MRRSVILPALPVPGLLVSVFVFVLVFGLLAGILLLAAPGETRAWMPPPVPAPTTDDGDADDGGNTWNPPPPARTPDLRAGVPRGRSAIGAPDSLAAGSLTEGTSTPRNAPACTRPSRWTRLICALLAILRTYP